MTFSRLAFLWLGDKQQGGCYKKDHWSVCEPPPPGVQRGYEQHEKEENVLGFVGRNKQEIFLAWDRNDSACSYTIVYKIYQKFQL